MSDTETIASPPITENTSTPSVVKRKEIAISHWPDSLLYHLFRACALHNEWEKPYRAITPISQTCRNWRRVALAHGNLWWDVYLGFDHLGQGLAFLKNTIVSGDKQPISVYVSSAGTEMTQRKLGLLEKAFAETQRKWSYLTIEDDCPKRVALFVNAAFTSRRWATRMTRLKVKHTGPNSLRREDLALLSGLLDIGARELYNLESCMIWGFPFVWLNFCAASLTVLDLRRISKEFFPSWYGFSALIKAAPSLEHLILIDVGVDLAEGCVPYPPLEAPKLKSLTLQLQRENSNSCAIPTFLRGIPAAPVLDTLVVSDLDGLTGFEVIVSSSRERRFPNLTSLSLIYADLSEEVLDTFFAATSGLKVLHIVEHMGVYRNLLNKARGGVWRKLEKVFLVKDDDALDYTIEDLLGSREEEKWFEIVQVTNPLKVQDWTLAGHVLMNPEHLFKGKPKDSGTNAKQKGEESQSMVL